MLPPDGRSEKPEKQKLFLQEKIEQEQKLRIPEWNSDGNAKRSIVVSSNTNQTAADASALVVAAPTTASFFQRALAHIIDDTLFSWLTGALILVCGAGSLLFLNFLPRICGTAFDSTSSTIATIVLAFLFGCLLMVAGWFYYALLDASEMEATPGKKMVGLRVCDLSEKRFTLFKASTKLLVQPAIWLAISLVLASGLLVATLPAPVQLIAGIVWVVLAGVALLTGIFGNLCFVNQRGQTVTDFFSKRLVLKRTEQGVRAEKARGFKLLSIEKKIVAAIVSTVVLFGVEICAINIFNVDLQTCFVFPLGYHVINSSGRVMRAKADIEAGTIIDRSMYETATMQPILAPPYAVEPSATLGKTLAYHAVQAGSILTYSQVLPNAKEIGSIISIEPLKENNEYVSRCTIPPEAKKTETNLIQSFAGSFGRSPLADYVPISRNIQNSLIESSKANQEKNFAVAFARSNEAVTSVVALSKKSNTVDVDKFATQFKKLEGALLKSQSLFSKKDIGAVPEWLRALMTDILLQRSVANTGLKHYQEATIDQKNCLLLLQSLHGNFALERMKSFGDVPNDDDVTTGDEKPAESTAKYLKMLGESDEKNYQNIARHIAAVIAESKVKSEKR